MTCAWLSTSTGSVNDASGATRVATVGAILIGLLGLNLLVILHELGHFIVAKRNGVEVEEFGLGFPPQIISWQAGRKFWRCRYSLNWLPIGGFVRLKGEHGASREPGSFGAAPLGAKLKILLAGVGVNFLIGAILLTILAVIGLPRLLPAEPFFADRQPWSIPADTYVGDRQVRLVWVEPDSAAAEAGLQPLDQIIAIDGQPIASQLHWQTELASRASETVELTIVRRRSTRTITAELAAAPVESANDSYLETDSSELVFEVRGWSAPLAGLVTTVQYTQLTIEGAIRALWHLVSGSPETAKELVGGPVGIIQVIKLVADQSWLLLILIIALLSLSLAVMNLLPLPALDGGQALIAIWCDKVRKRPLTPALEHWLQLISFAIIMVLFVVITIFADVPRL